MKPQEIENAKTKFRMDRNMGTKQTKALTNELRKHLNSKKQGS